MNQAENTDQYIAAFPAEVAERLQQIREIIRRAAPEATELISYGMPAFRQQQVLVYFAAFKNHIGFFPTSSGVAAFEAQLANYKTSKGTIQIPHNQPIPEALIGEIVRFRVNEVQQKLKGKAKKFE